MSKRKYDDVKIKQFFDFIAFSKNKTIDYRYITFIPHTIWIIQVVCGSIVHCECADIPCTKLQINCE